MVKALRGWKSKRDFRRLVSKTEQRILQDIGITEDYVNEKMKTPFWKF